MQSRRISRVRTLKPESYGQVIRAYRSSPKFTGTSSATQVSWNRELELAEEHLGHLSNREICPADVQDFLDGIAEYPGKQKVALTALRQVDKWALVRRKLDTPVTFGCEAPGSDGGHIPWSDSQVALAEQCAGDGFSRVVTLGVHTGQRISDLVRMCWNDLETFEGKVGINVRGGQRKTKRSQFVPLTKELAAAMATWERRLGPIVVTPAGAAWNPNTISTRWARQRDGNPALMPLHNIEFEGMVKNLTLHGLRATACVRLLLAGANTRQISDMVGMSEQTVKGYTRFAEQKRSAIAGVHHMDRTTNERKAEIG